MGYDLNLIERAQAELGEQEYEQLPLPLIFAEDDNEIQG